MYMGKEGIPLTCSLYGYCVLAQPNTAFNQVAKYGISTLFLYLQHYEANFAHYPI